MRNSRQYEKIEDFGCDACIAFGGSLVRGYLVGVGKV